MKKHFTITYDIITNSIEIDTDMTTFESLGMLEAAKVMIGDRWIQKTNDEGEC